MALNQDLALVRPGGPSNAYSDLGLTSWPSQSSSIRKFLVLGGPGDFDAPVVSSVKFRQDKVS